LKAYMRIPRYHVPLSICLSIHIYA